ncbi:hypothetical protein [Acinetobacter sp.]|uniref:hypothetical protein n=1 Tax=Acinetobacter sp. TaxID=472 RepID=UPI00388CF3F3
MSTIKKWEERQAESKEEFMEMPLHAKHFMEREIADQRARDVQMQALIKELDQYSACMSYNDSYFGEPPGHIKKIVRQMVKL